MTPDLITAPSPMMTFSQISAFSMWQLSWITTCSQMMQFRMVTESPILHFLPITLLTIFVLCFKAAPAGVPMWVSAPITQLSEILTEIYFDTSFPIYLLNGYTFIFEFITEESAVIGAHFLTITSCVIA
jgi:hypothetical protein